MSTGWSCRWRVALAGAALAGALLTPARPVVAETAVDQQELVDRATLAAQEVLNDDAQGRQARSLLPRARAVMICPRVFRASFLFGGEGGGCVLVARGRKLVVAAFYSMGAGSFGLQAGIEDAAFFMMILTDAGLRAVLDNQFRFGASASLAIDDRRRGGGPPHRQRAPTS